MKVYNTLSRKIEDFKPLHDGKVSLYTCGPTVYDFAQLGNLRAFVFDDTLRRALESLGLNVKHVMNITDVGHLASDMDHGEDKLEKGAEREGKTVWQVSDFYTNAFIKDAKDLNILPPNGYKAQDGPYAKATNFIDEQIEIIKILLDKEFAYKTEQAIYFDVSKLPDYGLLSHQKLSEKEVGARDEVVVDEAKRHPQDFALWFFLVGRFEDHSMHWPSPWGDGFPGWHLECSAIIHATLGDPIDIHTGGVDHIGTHHTNEMAQTEAAYGNKLANYWMHNDFLLVEGKRMGKSLGNFFTLSDIKKRGFDPLALRLLYLQAHYRSQMNFTWDSLEAAQKNLNDLKAFADLRWQVKAVPTVSSEAFIHALMEIKQAVYQDLNTPQSLAVLNGFASTVTAISEENKKHFEEFLDGIDLLFGLNLLDSDDITDEQKRLIKDREDAREQRDWEKSDQLRDKLKEQDLLVRDSGYGTIWQRV